MAKDAIKEIVSDNNLEDVSITISAAQLLDLGARLGAAQSLQSIASDSSVDNLMKDVSRNENNSQDVSETEAMKTMMPAWTFNQKLTAAAEFGNLLDTIKQNNAMTWQGIQNLNQQAINMIAQNNTINSSLADNLGGRFAAKVRDFDQLVVNPHYFAENAPAGQDTPGEGADTRNSSTVEESTS